MVPESLWTPEYEFTDEIAPLMSILKQNWTLLIKSL